MLAVRDRRSDAPPGRKLRPVIAPELVEALDQFLRARGRRWQPQPGDRFVIPAGDPTEVFVVADMTIEVHDLPTGRLIKFNGTTEWALDSIDADTVWWVPWEHQLRELLGDRFLSLARQPEGFVLTLTDGTRYVDPDPDVAYAHALLGRA